MSETYFQPDESPYEEGYVVVFNHVTINKDLSDAAYRLLNYLHSNSPTWVVRGRFTAKTLGWGKDKLTRAVRELYNLGFITRISIRENGRFDHFVYKYSYKQKFKNEAWATPKKRGKPKLAMLSNVDEIRSNTGELPAEALQPKPYLPAPVTSTPETQPIPKPNKPMPNLHGNGGIASFSKTPRAMDASRRKPPAGPSKSRKYPRSEDKENAYQWLRGLNLLYKDGAPDDDTLSVLAHKYPSKRLEDAYFHLLHKVNEKGVKARSPMALYRHLLDNEHNCRGTDSELNEAFAKHFALEMQWHTLDFKEKYVIDRNYTTKDISFNLEPATFREVLGNLYMTINSNYGT